MARINEKTLIKIAIAIGVAYLMYLVFVPRTCSMCSGHGNHGGHRYGKRSTWAGRGNGVYGLIDGTSGDMYGRLDYEDDSAADDGTTADTADTADTTDMFVEIPNEDDDMDGDMDDDMEDDDSGDDFEDSGDAETFALYENDLGRDSTVYM